MTTFRFGDFELNAEAFELRRGGNAVKMEPQVFDVLAYLVRHHERVVTKDELLEQVWGNKYVSEAALNSRLMAARRAIGDSGREQRLIQTIHGRGYRFVGALSQAERQTAGATVPAPVSDQALAPRRHPVGTADERSRQAIGRERELDLLDSWLSLAKSGQRQIVFLTGEAGIGKTTLLEAFADAALNDSRLIIGWGQCLEQRGGGEAYLPLFGALTGLCRDARLQDAASTILAQAPTWAAQMPALFSPQQQSEAGQRSLGTTGERMLREAVDVLEALSAGATLLLILEDLHWSDLATLDMLAGLARRQAPARLMVAASYRPGDVRGSANPLDAIKNDLLVRSLCKELALPPLPVDAVRTLLAGKPGREAPDPGLAELLHKRTDGNALFLTTLMDELALAESETPESAPDAPPTAGLPGSLRTLIEQQFDRLKADERALLEAASVAGPVFSSIEIAAAVESDLADVEERCEALARRGSLIVFAPEPPAEWPDGSVGGRYAFVHSLHQEVLYERLGPVHRAILHQRVGGRLEEAYGSQAPWHATELALHYTEGRDARRAVRYLELAAQQAKARGAYREAVMHVSRALEMVTGREDLEDRDAWEITLRSELGSALLVTHGFGHDAVLEQFTRALEIADRSGNTDAVGNVVLNLAALLEYRSQHRQAEGVLQRLASENDDSMRLPFHALLSCSYFHQGQFGKSAKQGSLGLSLSDPRFADPRFASLGEDPGNGCSEWSAEALWFLGYPDQALSRINVAVELAQRPSRQYTLASTRSHAARIHQLRREPSLVMQHAVATAALASEQGYVYHHAVALVLAGWASAVLGNASSGVQQMRGGIAAHEATGAGMDRPYFLALLAEGLILADRPAEALDLLDEALSDISPDRSFFYSAELHRLKGVALSGVGGPAGEGMESSLELALTVAREQEARSLELRTATTLALFRMENGGQTSARSVLQPVYGWFREGFDTPDLQEAERLLAQG